VERQLDYYYPGYIVMNFPKFDYKLEAGEGICEIYDTMKEKWAPYSPENILNAEAPPLA